MPDAFALANAFVRIRPTADGFRAEADAEIKSALAGLDPKVRIGTSTDAAKLAAKDLRIYLDAMAKKLYSFRMVADDKQAQASMSRMYTELLRLDKKISAPRLTLVGAAMAQGQLLAFDAQLDQMSKRISVAHVEIDDADAERRLALLITQVAALTSKAKEIRLGVSDPTGLIVIGELQKAIAGLADKVVTIDFMDVRASGQVLSQMRHLKQMMSTVGLADFLDINMNPGQILSQLNILRQRIASAHLTDTLGVSLDTSGMTAQISSLEASLRGMPQGVSITGGLGNLVGAEAQVKQISAAMDGLAKSEIAAAGAGPGGGANLRGWNWLLHPIPLFGGGLPGILGAVSALHLIVQAGLEITSTLIPAAIAFTAFGVAAIPTAQDIFKQMQNVNTVTQATGQNLYPVTGAFQKMADAVQPQVYQLFGIGLGVMNSQASKFTIVAKGAGIAIDQLAARAAVAIQSSGFSKMMQNAASDLFRWGTIVGNIFGIFGNFLKALPGYGQIFLNVLVGITRTIENLTGTGFVQGLLKAGLAIHGAFIYAGLGASALAVGARVGFSALSTGAEVAANAIIGANLGGIMDRLGVGVLGLSANAAGLAALPWTWIAVAAAGLGIFVYWVLHAKDATQQWFDNMQKVLLSQDAVKGFTILQADQAIVAGKLADAQANVTAVLVAQAQRGGTALGVTGSQASKTSAAYLRAVQTARDYATEQATLNNQAALYNTRLDRLAVAFGGVNQAQGLLTAAGIKMSDMLDGSKQKWLEILNQVEGTRAAYQAMGQTGDILGADMNALNVAASSQVTAMQKVNTAFDTVTGIISGGQTTFVNFEQALATVATNAGAAGASMTGLNAPSLTLRSSFQQAFTNASQLVDAMRLMQSASPGGFPPLTQAVKDTIAQMVPFAKTSDAAKAELVFLAQQINPNIHSFADLTKWLGNTKNAGADLSRRLSAMGVNLQDLAKDASNLYASLQANIINQFNVAKIAASGAGTAIHNLATDVTTAGTSSHKIHGDEATLYNDFLKSGLSAKDAQTLILSMSGGISLAGQTASQKHQSLLNLYNDFRAAGLSAKNAQGLVHALTGEIFNIPTSHHTDITATGHGAGGVTFTQTLTGQTKVDSLLFRAAGGPVPGHGNTDSVLAMLTPGETVVPKRLTPMVAPLMAAHGVPGFASGGFVGPELAMRRLTPWMSDAESSFERTAMVQAIQAEVAAAKAALAAAMQAMMRAFMPGAAASGSAAAAQAFAFAHLKDYFWGPSQMAPLISLWNQESGWNAWAVNPSSGAYGIPQSLGHGHPYNLGDYANQVRWGLAYIFSVYGSPAAAWAHEVANNWYGSGGLVGSSFDNGGWLMPGATVAINNTGKPERVGGPAQVVLEIRSSGTALDNAIVDIVRHAASIHGGGDVQLAFGSRM